MSSRLLSCGLAFWGALRPVAWTVAGKSNCRLAAAVWLVLVMLGVARTAAQGQTNEWTWMGGSSTASNLGAPGYPNHPGVYGTMGTPAVANIPGSRQNAVSWTDNAGNFWLFGGYGYDSGGMLGMLNDLWEFNPISKQWMWASGSESVGTHHAGTYFGQAGVYGTLGSAGAGDSPGGREGAVSWIDKNGNLWFFAGYGFDSDGQIGFLNDLWKFNPSNKEWTWMGGSDSVPSYNDGRSGVYGSLGIPAAVNIPGGRDESQGWIDSDGNFWLFGGQGVDSMSKLGELNDLWKFDPSTFQWVWMGGSSALAYDVNGTGSLFEPGVYGTQGVSASDNIPGSRQKAATWTDRAGNLWLFGGKGYDAASAPGELSDLWAFSPATNRWTWIAGSATIGVNRAQTGYPGVYGTWMMPALENRPGGRWGAVTWTDKQGSLWLFGGYGHDANNFVSPLSDLWEFVPSMNEWIWRSGNTTWWPGLFGTYGTLQTPAFGNNPGARDSALGWTDSRGNLWLFGGHGYDQAESLQSLNDLWKFQLDAGTEAAAATPIFSPEGGSYSIQQTVTISDTTPGAVVYYFASGSSTPELYEGPISVSSPQTIEAVAVASGFAISEPAMARYNVNLPVVATPVFSLASGTYSEAQTVTISCDTPGATIYYALNETPTVNSNVYSGPIDVSSSETIEAVAMVSDHANSATATRSYIIWPASAKNEWAWMGGGNNAGVNAVYGTFRVPAVGNVPGMRENSSNWIDKEDNLWLFGGHGYDAFWNLGILNDLWRFNLRTKEWEWVGGNSAFSSFLSCHFHECGERGNYGILGTPASGNAPGGRIDATTWTDKQGSFWLLGGYGFDAQGNAGHLNDLWKFDSVTNIWTWMSGSKTADACFVDGGGMTHCAAPGVNGVRGQADAGNVPYGREGGAAWTDFNGNLWLFGGMGFDIAQGVQYYFNDLWEYIPATSQWVWMGGSGSGEGEHCFQYSSSYYLTCGQAGVFQGLGAPVLGNIPGSRYDAPAWADKEGNFWLFGGNGFDALGKIGDPNDMWEFSPSTGEWAWMGGSSTVPPCAYYACSPPAVFGELNKAGAGTIPWGTYGAASWKDSVGNFWLFLGALNDDFWEFNPPTNEWAWMGGDTDPTSSHPGVYGSAGTPSPGNRPGDRWFPSSWTDGSGNFWLFGGQLVAGKTVYTNDLWEYKPTAPIAGPTFSLRILPDPVTLPAGSSGTVVVSAIVKGGFNSPISLSASGQPSGVTISLDTNPITDVGSSVMAITVDWGVTTGAYAITVTGASGNLSESATFNLLVTTPPSTPTPTFSPTAGAYTEAQSVTITDAAPDATIYYTTDGHAPTTNSMKYTGPIWVGTTETITAVAIVSGYGNSGLAAATYVIGGVQPSFNLAASPGSLTISSGGHGTVALTVTPENGFTSAVSFACSGLPTGASCSFNPATVTPAGSAVTTTLTIGAQTLGMVARNGSMPLWPGSALAAAVCLMGWKRRRGVLTLVLAVVALAGLGLVSGCGSGGGSSTTTPPTRTPVTLTVTVTATSGSIQKAAQVTLTVD